METTKEYPPGVKEEIEFLQIQVRDHWRAVYEECERLPAEARGTRIDRAYKELDVIFRRLAQLERTATIIFVFNREESRHFNFAVTKSSPAGS